MGIRSILVLAALGVLLAAPAARAAGPTVGESWSTEVTSTSARLWSEVDPEGLATTYRFEYITESGYEANVAAGHDAFTGASRAPKSGSPSAGAGTAVVRVSQVVTGLAPRTAYRYRCVVTDSAAPSGVNGSAHRLVTQELGGALALADGRGWELVSPTEKNGGDIKGYGAIAGGGVLQAAAAGGAITYGSTASFGAEAVGAPMASQYISSRGEDGWSTRNIAAATTSGAYGDEPNGVPYQLFSGDLQRGIVLDGSACAGEPTCSRSYTLREEGDDTLASPQAVDLHFVGATVDLRHVILSTCEALTEDATEVSGLGGCDPTATNLYDWSGGELTLLNLLPGAGHGEPGASLAAQNGAVSTDASRVYWAENGELFLRRGGVTRQVDESVGGGGVFQLASVDGEIAFFTKGGHLYRYLASSGVATDLTPSGGVIGVLGGSAVGSRVYYTTGAGIFLWSSGQTSEVASAAADPGDYPPATGTARVSSDGEHLAFLATASLTGADNIDQGTGLPDPEVYLYDAETAALRCVSCNPTGERPLGPSGIPGAIANGSGSAATDSYKPRVLSASGERLFFDSEDALAPLDSNQDADVYQWEADGNGSCSAAAGCLSLVSSGRGADGASFIDASANGSDVYFLTAESLVGMDHGSTDVYDAREGGGFPEPPDPTECEGDSCQPLPSEPADPAVGTAVPGGLPNPPLKQSAGHHKKRIPGKHHRTKHRRSKRGGDRGGKAARRGSRERR